MTPDSDSGPVERDIKADPREDPMLILKLTRLADKQQKGDSFRPDEGVSDPVPIMGSKAASGPESGVASAAKGGELAAAGAAKAEAAWRFAGKKPGSEVTDPAEWQDRKIRDLSLARMKHFEVIDPVEAPGLQSAMAKAQGGASAGAAALSVTISAVSGNVQKLATEGGKQGWAPLTAGSALAANSVIRVDNDTGGQVSIKDLNAALSLNWSKIHSSPTHTVWQVNVKK